MIDDALKSTTPKPFVFVLMPFAEDFNDIFNFGIKGAADDVGAHAERLDNQIFSEGMLDHIFNEISKADVIVADMTGRNPNVFYEVGYAHALGKIVLLLTKDSDDIPFDLKHRQHTVYGGSIAKLRKELAVKLEWAIAAAASKREGLDQVLSEEGYFDLYINEIQVYPSVIGITGPVVSLHKVDDETDDERGYFWSLKVEMHNTKERISPPVESVYLFQEARPLFQIAIKGDVLTDETATDKLVRCSKLLWNVPPLPKRATHVQYVGFDAEWEGSFQEKIRIRYVFPDRYFDYPLMIEIP